MPRWCVSAYVPDILLHNTTKYLRNLSKPNILMKILVKLTRYGQKNRCDTHWYHTCLMLYRGDCLIFA